MRRVIDLTEMLEDQDERRHEELVRQQLDWCSSWRSPRIAFSAGQWLPLLRSWWSSRLTSTTGPKSFSPPIQHSVFGLTTLQDFLLAFFLHQESKVGPKYSWQIHVLDQTRSPICEEAKLDLVLESASQEEKDEVLGKVKLKCWNVQAWHSGAVEYWPSPSGFHQWGKETKVSAGYQCCNCIQEAAMGFKLRLCVGKKETVWSYSTSTNSLSRQVPLLQHETDERICFCLMWTRELFHIKQNQTLLLFSVAVPSLFHICIMKKISMVLQWLICTWTTRSRSTIAPSMSPISPSYLVVLITSKRGKLISAGTLATVVASYVVLISWK